MREGQATQQPCCHDDQPRHEWKACDDGRISWPLVVESIGRSPSANVGPIRENVLKPQAILVEYADGTRGAVLNLIEAVSDFCFAGRLNGQSEPVSFYFDLPQPPGARFFDPLTWHIEQFACRNDRARLSRSWLRS